MLNYYENTQPNMLVNAYDLASHFHDNQFRKDGVTPYINHAIDVKLTVEDRFGIINPIILSACYLHDTVEDTLIKQSDFSTLSSDVGVCDLVFKLVVELSHKPEQTKDVYLKNLAENGSKEAILIKIADRICNCCDFLETDPKYAKKYYEKARPIFARFHSMRGDLWLYTYGCVNHCINHLKNQLEQSS